MEDNIKIEDQKTNVIYESIDIHSELSTKLPSFCNKSDSRDEQIEAIVNMAKQIWKKIIEFNIKNKITPQNEDMLLNQIRMEYNDFFLSFPLVLRWMVQIRHFKVKIFKDYIIKFLDAKIGSKLDFLKLQGDYVVMLYKDANPLANKSDIEKYESEIYKLLEAEDESFKAIEEEAKKELELEHEKATQDRKQQIYNSLMKKKLESK